ncbi:MAG: hypothetical protein ABIT76_12300 [Chthoniobacterales bacterium]
MDSSLTNALAAVLGSLVGGSATMATAWITQKTSTKRELVREELHKRETLYDEYICECSKLAIDALAHGIEQPEKMWSAYALLNRIRLSASAAVVAEAEAVLKRISEQYFSPNVSLDEFRALALSQEDDLLQSLGAACRIELEAIRSEG